MNSTMNRSVTLYESTTADLLNSTLNTTYYLNTTTAPPPSSKNQWVLEYWPALIANIFWDINTLPLWIRWMRFVGTPLIMTVGLIGNTTAFIVMMDRSMRKQTYAWYIATLAVCDTAMIGVRLCSWMNMISLAVGNGLIINFYDDASCIIAEGIPDVFQTTGAWMMATIAFERFMVVWFPFVSKRLTPRIAWIVIFCMFVLAILSTLYYIIYIRFVEEVMFCAVPQSIGWITQLYLGFPMEYIPALVIMVSNVLVIYSLSRRVSDANKSIAKSRNKITAMLMLLTFSFIILTLPAWIFEEIYKKYYGSIPKHIEMPTREIIEFFYQMNYCVNFFIYVISGKEVRMVLKRKLWNCCGCIRDMGSRHTVSESKDGDHQRSSETQKTNAKSEGSGSQVA